MQISISRGTALAPAAVLGAGAVVVQNVQTQPSAGAAPQGLTALFNCEDLTVWRGPAPDQCKITAMTDEQITEARAEADV